MTDRFPPISTDSEHKFSKHDNRHALRSNGEYFDLGLGRRRVENQRNQHLSENHISWIIPCAHKDNTVTFSACSTHTVDKKLLDKFAVGKRNFRRFPHHHALPDNSISCTASRAEWLDNNSSPTVTPLWVLAVTQQPHLKHSPWVYAYKH